MKDRVALAVWVFALTAAAQQAQGQAVARPSPTGEAQYGDCTAGEVRTITIA